MSSKLATPILLVGSAAALVLAWTFFSSSRDREDKIVDNISQLPLVDLSFQSNKEADPISYRTECKRLAKAFHDFGIVIVKDPRVSQADNELFLDMMERYFEGSDGIRDARPEYHYQVGVTPANTERPRDHCRVIGAMGPDDKPLSPCPPEFDPKWRFFWRIGPTPSKTRFQSLNMDAVIPPEIPEWKDVMDRWGGKMLDAVTVVAEMAAVGFDMAPDAFTSRMEFGPHLLAPTGSDYSRFGDLGRVLAGFHYDLNFMTIHGKNRYPGLFIWTRNGKKVPVKVPDGCLLVQAGKQLEYLTGGHVLAGFHEVVICPRTLEVINERRDAGKSLWRVSSTLFSHIASDQVLEPLSPFSNESSSKSSSLSSPSSPSYPPVFAGDQVREELQSIRLDRSRTEAKR